jgi:hypothetical protein
MGVGVAHARKKTTILYMKVTINVCLSVQVLKPISQKKSLAAKGKKVPYVTSSSCPWQQKEKKFPV